jgi:hypothetical protein
MITVKQELGNCMYGDGGGCLIFRISYHFSHDNIRFNQLFLELVQCGVCSVSTGTLINNKLGIKCKQVAITRLNELSRHFHGKNEKKK